MTTSQTPEPIADESIEMIRVALTELQSERDHTESFMNEMLDTLETLRIDLAENEQKLRVHQDELVKRESEVDQSLSEMQKREETFAAQQAELQAANASLEELQNIVAVLQSERDEAVRKLDEALAELALVAEALSELKKTQAELDETRQQLKEAKASLRDQQAGADAAELQQIQVEKHRLATELSKSQSEAEELAAQVKEQAEELASHQQRWSGEIGSMRESLKNRAESLLVSDSFDFDEPTPIPEEELPEPCMPAAMTEDTTAPEPTPTQQPPADLRSRTTSRQPRSRILSWAPCWHKLPN